MNYRFVACPECDLVFRDDRDRPVCPMCGWKAEKAKKAEREENAEEMQYALEWDNYE